MAASRDPRVSGPLSLAGSKCGPDEAKHEGKTIAKVKSCLWLYEFDSTRETDLLRNYGVGWVQTTVNPVNGWCATKVDSNLNLPVDMRRHSTAPTRRVQVARASRTTVKLKVDADGHAIEKASVAQSFKIFPKSWKPTLSDDGRKIGTVWRGRESSTLAFALGAEVSWESLATPRISGGLGKMSFVKSRGC